MNGDILKDRAILCLYNIMLLGGGNATAGVQSDALGILIPSGSYRTLGCKSQFNSVVIVQEPCGAESARSSVFFTKISFGIYRFVNRLFWRSIYTFKDRILRSAEAMGEVLMLQDRNAEALVLEFSLQRSD